MKPLGAVLFAVTLLTAPATAQTAEQPAPGRVFEASCVCDARVAMHDMRPRGTCDSTASAFSLAMLCAVAVSKATSPRAAAGSICRT